MTDNMKIRISNTFHVSSYGNSVTVITISNLILDSYTKLVCSHWR